MRLLDCVLANTFFLHLILTLHVVCACVYVQVTAGFISLEQKQYAGAGAVAEEVLSSVRTVFTFSGEKKEIERYTQKLRSAMKLGTRKGLLSGILTGLRFFLILAMHSLAFW